MHDFLLAKEIIDELEKIATEKKLDKISKVSIEIGTIALAHDGYPEHAEDISIDNLKFGLESIASKSKFKNIDFSISKVKGENWRIMDIVVK